AGRAAPPFTGAVAVPRPVHPQVRPQFEAAVEPDQQVLALRLDRVDPLPDDPLDLRHGSRTLGPCSHDVTTHEVWAEALRGPEERVTFGHDPSLARLAQRQ